MVGHQLNHARVLLVRDLWGMRDENLISKQCSKLEQMSPQLRSNVGPGLLHASNREDEHRLESEIRKFPFSDTNYMHHCFYC
jgi:hypothetical protein